MKDLEKKAALATKSATIHKCIAFVQHEIALRKKKRASILNTIFWVKRRRYKILMNETAELMQVLDTLIDCRSVVISMLNELTTEMEQKVVLKPVMDDERPRCGYEGLCGHRGAGRCFYLNKCGWQIFEVKN